MPDPTTLNPTSFDSSAVIPSVPQQSAADVLGGSANPLSAITSPTAYDPNNPTPYRPSVMPNVDQPIADQPMQQQPIRDLGATTHAGGVAYMGDQLLRGYMQGRAVAEARKAQQLNQTSQGLQGNLDSASKDLYALAQSGVDPQSQQFQDAQNRVQAAWKSYMDFAGQHVQGLVKDKKTGQPVTDQSGNTQAAGKPNLLQRMFSSQDPAQIAPAWYEALQKTGPPVLHQIAPMLTPEYQAKAQQRAATLGTNAQTATTTAQTNQQAAQNQLRVQQLVAKAGQPGGLTEDEQDQLTSLQTGIAAGGKGGNAILNYKPVPGSVPTLNKDTGHYEITGINERGQTRQLAMPTGFTPNASALKGQTRFELADGLWQEYQVNGAGQEISGTRRPLSTAAANPGTSSSTTGQHIDPITGQVYTTTSTTSRHPNATGASTGGGGSASTTATPTPSHAAGGGGSANPPSSTNPSAAVRTPSYFGPAIGKAQNTLTEATRVARLADDPSLASNGSSQYLLLSNLLHSTLGRVNQQEINQLFATAGWGAKADTWLQRAANGEMSPQLVQQLVQFAHSNQKAAAKDVADLVQQAHGSTARGGAATPPPASTSGAPATAATHAFSVSAWQSKNPKGDVNAAKAAATQQGYKVVP